MGSPKIHEKSNGNDDGHASSPTTNNTASPTTNDNDDTKSKYLRKGIDNPYFHPTSKRFNKLPEWLDHFNAKDLKVLFKCWAAAWIYSLFIVINPALRAIGQAVFFGAIVIFMAPPSGVVFIGLMAGATLILGVCLGWAWGSIAMKAALATRSTAELNARYIALQQSATRNTTNVEQASGQTSYAQIAIFNGFMLDARISAVYFCLIGLFVYFMARLRVKAPKLTLTAIFSMVIADIYLTIAPLIPTFQGTIAQTLVKPAGIAVGVAFACNIFIFPRSTSHIVLDEMQNLLTPMGEFLEACMLFFREPTKHMELDRLVQTKGRTIAAYKAVEGGMGFLSLDASIGRWSAQDVATLQKPLRRVLVAFLALLQVQISSREFKIKDQKLLDMAEAFGDKQQDGAKAGYHQLARTFDWRQKMMTPDGERLKEESLKSLAISAQDILNSCQDSILAITESLHNCNTRRWINRLSAQDCAENRKNYSTALDKLRKNQEKFAERAAEELWKPHQYLFDDEGHILSVSEKGMPPAGGVMLTLVFEEKIYDLANTLEILLDQVVTLEENRIKTKLWLPAGLRNLFSWAMKDDDTTAENASASTGSVSSSSEKKAKVKTKRSKKHAKDDEDTKPTAAAQLANMKARGGIKRGKGGRIIINIVHWLTNTEGMFALRMLILTIALGIPAVIPSSAGFYYREKGLWGLIMAQTGLLPYSADFLFGFITRMMGTVVGAVIGLVVWYIGAGNGPGNPYGMAAALGAVLVVFMWCRLYLPPATMQATVLAVATCYLVVGYSWSDTHIPSYGNPGVGYSVMWRRMLLVMIGFTAAAIVTFFPKPPSANRHYRRLLSDHLGTVKNQFTLFTANCKHPLPDLLDVAEKTALASSELLASIEPTIQLTKLEFSTSNFDAATLSLVCHLCMNLNQSVTQLLLYVPSLSERLKDRFALVTGVLEEQLMADVMAVLTLIQQALKTGDPLPVVLPVPLLARSAESVRLRVSNSGKELVMTFNKQMLAEEGARKYCSAMSAYVQFLSAIDELVVVVKTAVGETSYVDVERL